MSDSAPSVLKARRLPLRVFVVLMLLAVFAWSAWNTYGDYRSALDAEYRLLEVRARHSEARISGALRSVNLMLGSIIDDRLDLSPRATENTNRLLKSYMRQLPELRNLLIVDASGRIRADARAEAVGKDASDREYFKAHSAAPTDDRFHLSRPFKAFSGVTATTLSRVIRDGHGRFAGIVVASLESGFFNDALKISIDPQHEPDVQSVPATK